MSQRPYSCSLCNATFFFFLRFYFFLERGEGREKEGKKHQCVVAARTPPTGDLARNPGMCPDWGSNWRAFASQSRAQSTEPHQPVHDTTCYTGQLHPSLSCPSSKPRSPSPFCPHPHFHIQCVLPGLPDKYHSDAFTSCGFHSPPPPPGLLSSLPGLPASLPPAAHAPSRS